MATKAAAVIEKQIQILEKTGEERKKERERQTDREREREGRKRKKIIQQENKLRHYLEKTKKKKKREGRQKEEKKERQRRNKERKKKRKRYRRKITCICRQTVGSEVNENETKKLFSKLNWKTSQFEVKQGLR